MSVTEPPPAAPGAATVRRATVDDAEPLVALLATAFYHDAVAAWIFPDPERRRQILPDFFRAFYRLSLDGGEIYTTDERNGVLLSMAPGAGDPGPGFEGRLAGIAGEYAEALLAVTRLQDAHRPGRPHHYLSFGCVSPSQRRTGLATALVAEVLRRCDRAGTPAYLEASSPSGRGAARHNGFAPVGGEIRIPGGPTLRPMWREPHVRTPGWTGHPGSTAPSGPVARTLR